MNNKIAHLIGLIEGKNRDSAADDNLFNQDLNGNRYDPHVTAEDANFAAIPNNAESEPTITVEQRLDVTTITGTYIDPSTGEVRDVIYPKPDIMGAG